MNKVVYYIAASLDGYIADADGGVGWLEAFNQPDEDYGYSAFYRTLGAVIIGRRTYEQALGFGEWPYEGVTTVVMSRQSPDVPEDKAIEIYNGDLTVLLQRLKGQTDKDIWLVGGSEVAAAFWRADLIDRLILTIIPVMLGGGVPLFRGGEPPRVLALDGVTPYPNGLMQLRYRVQRPA
jgi:dihydrofolate reductase